MTGFVFTTLTEDRVLAYFWMMAGDAAVDRLALLRQLGTVAIPRGADWDRAAVRASMPANLTHDGRCFACRSGDRRLYWHHVIEVAHGGSSTRRNLVPVCGRCHVDLHPWLAGHVEQEKPGWESVGHIIERMRNR